VPSLEQLAKNLENYRYYSGYGTFNANNLPYGKDRPGGGDSRQPFVVRGVDTRWSPSNFDDGLTPFGVVTLASRTAADLSRVTQFLYTTTKGPLFLLKQTGLQRSNPNIRQIDVDTFDKKTIPTQLYNPLGLNTLAQVALGALGARFTKHGLIPQTEEQDDYAKYVLDNDKEQKNRLQNLLTRLGDANQNVLYKYGGGPQSIFGIGNTSIKRYYKSINNKIVDPKSGFISIPVRNLQKIYGDSTFEFKTGYVDINRISENEDIIFSAYVLGDIDPRELDNSFFTGDSDNNYSLGSTYDFRAYKNALQSKLSSETGPSLPTSNYQQYNIEKRIGVAKPRRKEDKVNYTSTGSIENSDRINLISLYYNNSPILPKGSLLDINNREVNLETTRDLIKFKIKVYDNDRNLDPKGNSYGVYILFRAYITNVRRNVTSKWDAYKYVGRGESFYAYDGFTETVTVSFTIAASSRAEMKPLYQKLNYLISTLAPDYSSAGLMRGNISELTIGDFLLYQPGIITSLDMIIDEDSNWEIALSEPENINGGDADMHELPQLIKCTMTFIPIYNFLPRKSVEAPFIGIDGLSEKKEGKQWLTGKAALLNDVRTAPPVENR
jgi:hypothetical protein